METEQELLERKSEESRQVALDIEEGRNSRYWKHLQAKISGWMEAEQKHLELLNMRLIRLPEDIEERNDAVKRIGLLKQFLKINDTIRDENLAVVDSIMSELRIEMEFANKPNFVSRRLAENNNGR